MVVFCLRCFVAFDDAVFLTYCPHARVDGAPVDPLTIFAAIALADAYLRDAGLSIEYRGGS